MRYDEIEAFSPLDVLNIFSCPVHVIVVVVQVKLSLDGAADVYLSQVDKTPLFVGPWKPEDYAQGLHSIRVTAEVTSKSLPYHSYTLLS